MLEYVMQTTADTPAPRLAERAVDGSPLPAGDSPWVTMEELSGEIRVPVRTLYKWREDGQAPRGARFGRHIRMRREDVDAWIAERMDASA